jgi:fimbrial isopeptide formation D2 family protein/uncharacterized repeat protein (TIGR01451 family)
MKLFNQKNFAGAALAAVLLCLGWGAPAARAGVQISMGYPLSATPCDTLSVTTTVVNAGATLSQLQVSEQLPGGSASYSYVTNSMQVTVPGLPTQTNEASILTILNGTNLVFNLANLQSTNGLTNLVLSEVFPGAAANQSWFEIYNPTPNAISTLGWSVRDARPGYTDAFPPTTIPAGQYLVVAASTNIFLAANPGFSHAVTQLYVNFEGNGLGQYADGLFLVNSNGVVVDKVSWGFDTSAFNPSVPYPTTTTSIARVPANVDTGTAADWVQQSPPTPGTGTIQNGLAAGATVNIVYQLTAKCGGIGGFFNTTATYEQPSGGATQTNNFVDFIAFANPVLLVSKTPQEQQGTLGGLVTWQLQVVNSGFGTAHNTVLYDSIGSGLTFVGFSIPPTTANPLTTNAVYWDQSAIAALAGLTNGETPVSITVTARVNSCAADLNNRGDASFGCNTLDLCQDTRLDSAGASSAIEYVYNRPYVNFSITPSNNIVIPYCGGTNITLSVTNLYVGGGADAYNIGVAMNLIPGYTLTPVSGPIVTNSSGDLIVADYLAEGASSNILLHIEPGGSCPLNTNLVAQLLTPIYNDACGINYAAPILPILTELTGVSAAALDEEFSPAAVMAGTTTNVNVLADLVYTNMGSGIIPQTLTQTYPTNAGWGTPTSITGGGVLNTSAHTITWTTNVSVSGQALFSFVIPVTKPLVCSTNIDEFTLTPAAYLDCHGCSQQLDTNSLDGFFETYGCGSGSGGGGCDINATLTTPAPLVETCQAQPFTLVITNLTGTYASHWTNVAVTASLSVPYASTNSVQVLVNGVNETTNITVTQSGGSLQVHLDGLNKTAFSSVTSVTNLQISWDAEVSTAGQVSQIVQFNLCSEFLLQNQWAVGTSLMHVTLNPPFLGFECGKITIPIGIQQMTSPYTLLSTNNALYPDYDVDVVLNLDPTNDPEALGIGTPIPSLSFVTNSTVLAGIITNAAGHQLILTNVPVVTNNLVIWHLGNLGVFTNGSINCQFQMRCGGAPIQQIQAVLRYNNRCEEGTTPQALNASSPIQLVSDQSSSLSEGVTPSLITMTSTNFNFVAQFFNAGASAAHNFFIEVQVPTNIVLTSATVPWNYVYALNPGTNAYHWSFTNNTAPLQGLVDDLGDGSFNDLAYQGQFTLSVTGAVISCVNQTINTIAGSGCFGSVCQQVGPLPVTLEPLPGQAVAMLVFPTALPVCTTNSLYYVVRNASLGSLFQVTPSFFLPDGVSYIPGSAVATNKLSGQHMSIPDPTGLGTAADPFTWDPATVSYLQELDSANDVTVGFQVKVDCDATVSGQGGASATYLDACHGLNQTALELSAGLLGIPNLSLTKVFLDVHGNAKTESMPGETNVFYLTISPTAQSAATVRGLQLTDYFPTNSFQFLGASIRPDSTAGGNLTWSNSTLMAAIPNQNGGPYYVTSAPISLVVTGLTLESCSSPAVNNATLAYGCADSMCQSVTASASVTMTAQLATLSPSESMTLNSCGGTFTTTIANSGAAASGIILTNYAPAGYLFAGATVSGALYNPTNQEATITLLGSGASAGETAILNLSNTNLTNVRGTTNYAGGAAGTIWLGPGQSFTVTYSLIPNGATLDCTVNQYPPAPVPVTVTNIIGFNNYCGSPATATATFTALPDQPKPTVTLTPAASIVTNGQIQDFVITLENIGDHGSASNLEARVLFQNGWTNLVILGVTNNATGSTASIVLQTNAENGVLANLGQVVLAPLQTVEIGVQAQANANGGSLAVTAELVGGCGVTSPGACSTFSPTNPLAMTMPPSPGVSAITNDTIYGFYQAYADAFGFNLTKTVRYASETAAAAGTNRIARIGEPLTYRITAQYFDAPFTNIIVNDSLPPNLVYGTPVDAGSSANVSGWTYNPANGNFTLPTPVTNDATFVIDFPVTVTNGLLNQAGVSFTNSASSTFQTVVTNLPPPVSTVVAEVEPSLSVTTLVSTTPSNFAASVGGVEASNTLYYQVVITNLPGTNAYNLWLSNNIPAGFMAPTIVSVATTGSILTNGVQAGATLNNNLLNFNGGSLNLGTNVVEVDTNSSITIVFSAQPGYTVQPNENINDQSTIQWTSMPGSVPQERTGVGLIPPAGTNDSQPVTSTNILNNYADTSAAAVTTIKNVLFSKVLIGTDHTAPGNNSPQTVIGERAAYTLTLDVPQGITTNATITDTLPGQLAFVGVTNVSWSGGVSNSQPITVSTAPAHTVVGTGGQLVTFSLGNVTNLNNNDALAGLTITFQAVALDLITNRAGTNLVNVATFTTGSYSTNVAAAPVTVVEPQLQISELVATNKSGAPGVFTSSVSSAQANDTVYYEIIITNGAGLYNTTAYDLYVSNSLPAGLLNPTVYSVVGYTNQGNIFSNGVPQIGSLSTGLFGINSANVLTNNSSVELDLATNSAIVVFVSGQLSPTVNPNTSIIDTNTIEWASLPGSQTGLSSYNTASNERTGVSTPLPGANVNNYGNNTLLDNYAAAAAATINLISPNFTKTLVGTDHTAPGNGSSQAVIGERASYVLTFTMPQGVITGASILDTLPRGMGFIGVTNVTWSAGVSNSQPITVSTNPANMTFSAVSNTVTFNLGNVTNANSSDLPATLSLTLQTVELDTNILRAGSVSTNKAKFYSTQYTSSTQTSASVTVVEPQLQINELISTNAAGVFTPSVATVQGNDTVYYEVIITNGAGAYNTTAYNLYVSNSLPAGLVNPAVYSVTGYTNLGNIYSNGVPQIGSLSTGLFGINSANVLTNVFNVELDLETNAAIVVVVSAQVSPTIQAQTTIIDTNTIEWQSLSGPQTNQSAYSSFGTLRSGISTPLPGPGTNSYLNTGMLDNYSAAAAASLTVINPSFAKVLVGTDHSAPGNVTNEAVIGELASYTLTVTVPQGVTPNAQIVDTMPANLAFVGVTNVNWAANVTNSQPVTVATNPANAVVSGSGQNITFNLGNITNLNTSDVPASLSITYRAVVLDVLTNQAGTNLANTATFTAGAYSTNITTAPITVVEPTLQVTESISANNATYGPSIGGVEAGDTVYYQLVITNSAGLLGTTAYDLWLSNSLPAGLVNPSVYSVTNLGTGDVYTNGVTATNGLSTSLFNFTGNLLSVAGTNQISLDTNGAIVVVVSAQLAGTVEPGQSLADDTTIEWSSLPGTQTNLSAYNSASNERTGVSTPLPAPGVNNSTNNTLLDNYAAASGVILASVPAPVLSKGIVAADEPGVTGNSGVNGTNATIGELVTYRITVGLPQGTTTNLVVTDQLPAGLAFVTNSVVLQTSRPANANTNIQGTGSEAFGGSVSLPTVSPATPTNGPIVFTFPTVTVNADGDTNNNVFSFTYQAVVLYLATNSGLANAQTTWTNTFTWVAGLTSSNGLTDASGNVVAVVEPNLNFTQSVLVNNELGNSCAYLGSPVVYTLTVKPATNSLSTAYNVGFSDQLPLPIGDTATTPLTLANVVITNSEGVDLSSYFTLVNGLLSTTNGSTLSLATNDYITIVVNGVVSAAASPVGAYANPATLTYSTRNGDYTTNSGFNPNPYLTTDQERLYAATNSTAFTLNVDSIAGYVYADTNNDGVFEAGESGLAGVTVTLTGTNINGQVVSLSTNTASNGSYVFGSLLPGDYILDRTSTPAGYVDGKETAGTPFAGVVNNLTNSTTISAINISTCASDNGVNYNFGLIQPNSLSGMVFADLNRDGLYDNTDYPITNVVITLTGTNYLGQSITNVMNTLTNGTYDFTGLLPGTYAITETQPAGYGQGTNALGSVGGTNSAQDVFSNITLTQNQNGTNYNYGEVLADSISGYVYADANDDGIFQNTETPLSGVTVTLTGTNINGQVIDLSTNTAVNGYYYFGGLLPGNYVVDRTTTPAGYIDGKETAGTPFGGTVDNTTTNSTDITGITIPTGGVYNGINYNLGLIQPASVSGLVFADLNRNGLYDGTDYPITNVTITLTGTNILGQNVTNVLQTLANGTYDFTNLLPGAYSIAETQPAAYGQGTNAIGTAGGTNPTQDVFANIVLGQNQNGLNYNFGETVADSISGYVYADANNDGIFQNTETPLGGVTVTLTGTNINGQAIDLSTNTAVNGYYYFGNLLPGNYVVDRTTTPAGYIDGKETAGTPFGGVVYDSTFGSTVITGISIPTGGSYNGVNYNLGLIQPNSLSGTVFADLNDNGIEDGTDYPITNVVITLTGTNYLGQSITNVMNTLTNGTYDFTGLLPGNYTITETQPAGYGQGTNALGSMGGTNAAQDVFSDIVLDQNDNGTNYNFGEVLADSISGYVYADANDDGVFQNTETPLAGVTVTLTGTNINGQVIDLSTNTAVNGYYYFGNLLPGDYVVDRTTTPAGYIDGKETAGTPFGGTVDNTTTNSTDITGITIPTGGVYNGINYNLGLIQPASVSGLVFADLNRNGLYDGTDYPITNVTITLTGTNILGQNVTNVLQTLSDGTYDFTGLLPGAYAIAETQPAGYGQGTNALGTAGGTNPSQDVFAGIVLGQNQNGLHYNFGETVANSISGYVYDDANNDGTYEPGEPPLGGVTVTLTGTNFEGQVITLSTNTAPDGSYDFGNLLPGNYVLDRASTPAGYINGEQTPGTPFGGTVNNPAGSTYITGITIPMTGGLNGVNYDFGLIQPNSLAGTVFADLNRNGIEDGTDYPITNVTVTLTGTNYLGNTVSNVFETLSNGTYSFTGLLPGTYALTETQPAGYGQGTNALGTTGGTNSAQDVFSDIVLTQNQNGTNYNYGETLGEIGSYVWIDANADGVRQPAEQGIPGVLVFLDLNHDGIYETNEPSAITDSQGYYLITNVLGGTYSVVVATNTLPPGASETYDLDGTNTQSKVVALVLPAGGSRLDANFGYRYVSPTLATMVPGSFQGYATNGGVELTWTTLTEIDMDYFIVNRLTATGAQPVAVEFALYPYGGSYSVIDSDATAPGTYQYQLVAVDKNGATPSATCTVVVGTPIVVTIQTTGGNVILNWTGGTAPYHLYESTALTSSASPSVVANVVGSSGTTNAPAWSEVPLTDSTTNSAVLPIQSPAAFFRVSGGQ